MRLVLLGPPGAGKGTQAEKLVQRFDLVHIATGDILRDNVARGTELGRRAKGYMDGGELVPDDVVVGMVAQTLARAPGGFLLDGFPRTIPQAEALQGELERLHRPLTAAVALILDDETVVRRIAGRRVCASCQRPCNVEFDAPRVSGRCDACGGELVQREDDKEDTVRRRLAVYRQSTAPLLKFYSDQGLLREVDGSGTEDEVAARIGEALSEPATERTGPAP